MHVTFVKGARGKKGFVEIEDARLIFKNFAGEPSKYNKEGDRNFCIAIPNQDIADSLKNDLNEFGVGWNVKIRPPRDVDEDPFMFLKVKLSFNGNGPDVFLITNGKMNRLDEESIAVLDHVDISHVDLSIRPYDDEINGRPFRSAYLRSIYVTQNVDRLAARYAEEEYPEE